MWAKWDVTLSKSFQSTVIVRPSSFSLLVVKPSRVLDPPHPVTQVLVRREPGWKPHCAHNSHTVSEMHLHWYKPRGLWIDFVLPCNLAHLSFKLFKYSHLHFPLSTLPSPTNPHLLPTILPPFGLSMDHLYMFLDNPSPAFPCYIPPPSPLFTVSLFFISKSLVIFCLLNCFVD